MPRYMRIWRNVRDRKSCLAFVIMCTPRQSEIFLHILRFLTVLKEAVQTTGDFTLAADKYFYKIGIVKDNGKIEVENQGTDGCKTFLNKTTFAIPGTEEEASGFIDQANNDELIILVPQRNGKCRIIGSEDFSPELSLKQDTGAAATDSNTTTVEASATDFHPAPFYTGKIHTADGDIDGATCKLTAAAAEKPNP